MTIEEVRESLIHGVFGKLTICETLRQIYDLIDDLPDQELKVKITDKLVEATMMATKIVYRLEYYHDTYKDTTGHNLSNLKEVSDCNELKIMREKRII